MKRTRRTRRFAIGMLAVAGMAAGLLATAASTPRHAVGGASTATAVLAAYKNPAPGSAPSGHSGGTLHNPVWGHQGNLRTLRPGPAARSQATVYDPDDPIDSGCWDANAYIASSASLSGFASGIAPGLGYVANWYSPDCGTNWAETVLYNDPGYPGQWFFATIVDTGTGQAFDNGSPVNGTYTDMTQSGTTVACASGDFQDNYGIVYSDGNACA